MAVLLSRGTCVDSAPFFPVVVPDHRRVAFLYSRFVPYFGRSFLTSVCPLFISTRGSLVFHMAPFFCSSFGGKEVEVTSFFVSLLSRILPTASTYPGAQSRAFPGRRVVSPTALPPTAPAPGVSARR